MQRLSRGKRVPWFHGNPLRTARDNATDNFIVWRWEIEKSHVQCAVENLTSQGRLVHLDQPKLHIRMSHTSSAHAFR